MKLGHVWCVGDPHNQYVPMNLLYRWKHLEHHTPQGIVTLLFPWQLLLRQRRNKRAGPIVLVIVGNFKIP
jgi:hypothetical protein